MSKSIKLYAIKQLQNNQGILGKFKMVVGGWAQSMMLYLKRASKLNMSATCVINPVKCMYRLDLYLIDLAHKQSKSHL